MIDKRHLLENLVRLSAETEWLEFKRNAIKPESIGEYISALANAACLHDEPAGYLVFGIEDQTHKVVGTTFKIKNSTVGNEELENWLIRLLKPRIDFRVEELTYDGKQIEIFIVDPAHNTPVAFKNIAYIHVGSYKKKLSDFPEKERKIWQKQNGPSTWERILTNEYDIDDLDHDEIYATITDGIRERRLPASAMKDDVTNILLRSQLIKNNKLTNAALILFAKNSVHLSQNRIKMARFKGKDKLGDFIDNQQVSGNAFKLLQEADFFLQRHLPIASTFKSGQLKRIDQPALPAMAVREALINALVHRDYADRSTDISCAIYDDRLELWNSGALPRQLSLRDLKHAHESILRNELIANVFYLRGYIEKWGTGTNKMVSLCKDTNIPEPEFSMRTGGLLVTFKFKKAMSTADLEATQKPQLTHRQEDILQILRTSPSLLNANEIHKCLGVTTTLRTIQKDLTALEKASLVVRSGKARNILWHLAP